MACLWSRQNWLNPLPVSPPLQAPGAAGGQPELDLTGNAGGEHPWGAGQPAAVWVRDHPAQEPM